MKIKSTVLTIFSIFFTFGALYAQNQIPLQGDVSVEDDPTTTTVTEGNLDISGNLVVGSGSVTGTNSISFQGAIVEGLSSFAVGSNNTVASNDAYVLGSYNSLYCGAGSVIGNHNGLVMGYANIIGSYSWAECLSDSFLIGYGNNFLYTSDVYAFGKGLMSEIYMGGSQVVLGFYNLPFQTDSSSWVLTDPLFVIGNGQSNTNRSNALVMLKNGNTNLNGELTVKKVIVTEVASGIPMGPFARQEQE